MNRYYQNYQRPMQGRMMRPQCGCQPAPMPAQEMPGGNSCCNPMPEATGSCGESTGCECLENMPLAMAYVPWQQFSTVYEPEVGFCKGTIFPELDLPFVCGGGN